jgi:predicted  nucleic acid-binding Zn-ribbon protein
MPDAAGAGNQFTKRGDVMKTQIAAIALCALLVVGCNNDKEELQKQLADAQNARTSLQQDITDRDAYFEQVMKSVNEVYADLEKARIKEGELKKKGAGVEGPAQYSNVQSRDRVIQNINEIGTSLQENRKKIAALQVRAKQFKGQIAGLNTLIENLKTSIQERETSITQLQAKVEGLQATMAEKSKLIEARDMTISDQTRTMNTVFYVVGTKDELRKKGIITDEGGFLWGLLGSTTIMNPGFDQSNFTAIDKTKDQTIKVDGKIEEILPRRNADLFAATQKEENSSELTITSPGRFWQQNYLVIVKD